MKIETIAAIRDALKAENPQGSDVDPGSMVVIGAMVAVQQVDETWREAEKAGTPSTTDYAARVIGFLRKQHSTADVTL